MRISEVVYAGMAQITPASNVRVLETDQNNDEWVVVEYDWPEGEPDFMTTAEVMGPLGLEHVPGGATKAPGDPLQASRSGGLPSKESSDADQ